MTLPAKSLEEILTNLKKETEDISFTNLLFEKSRSSYKKKLYKFSFMSSSEFAKQYLGYKPKQVESEETENEPVLINSRIDRGSCEDVPY